MLSAERVAPVDIRMRSGSARSHSSATSADERGPHRWDAPRSASSLQAKRGFQMNEQLPVRVDVPSELRTRGVTAIFWGACPGDHGWEKGTKAHTHGGDVAPGTICVADQRDLWTADGKPSAVLWHETAHVMVGDRERAGHGRLWRAAMAELGQPVRVRYR